MANDTSQKDTIQRLRRIEGQIKGIQKMIDDQRPCDEVMTQMMAVRAALDQVAKQVVAMHVDECLATLPPERARAAIGRAIHLLSKMLP